MAVCEEPRVQRKRPNTLDLVAIEGKKGGGVVAVTRLAEVRHSNNCWRSRDDVPSSRLGGCQSLICIRLPFDMRPVKELISSGRFTNCRRWGERFERATTIRKPLGPLSQYLPHPTFFLRNHSFFLCHLPKARELELDSFSGKDNSGGLERRRYDKKAPQLPQAKGVRTDGRLDPWKRMSSILESFIHYSHGPLHSGDRCPALLLN